MSKKDIQAIKRRIRMVQGELAKRNIDVEILKKQRRVRTLRVRLTLHEYLSLQRYAASKHTTASKLVRDAIKPMTTGSQEV